MEKKSGKVLVSNRDMNLVIRRVGPKYVHAAMTVFKQNIKILINPFLIFGFSLKKHFFSEE